MRALVQSWLADNTGWHPIAWRSDVLATRIFAWIVHFDEIASREADRLLRRAMLASLVAQLRHLARTAAWELAGAARLRALERADRRSGRARRAEKRLSRALRALERELPVQILPDGGHAVAQPIGAARGAARPDRHARGVARRRMSRSPRALQDAIDRMAPMLRFFRHGDRRLALFNNSVEEDGVLVDLVLTRSETKGRAPTQAPHTGFQRLQAGHSLVLVDTGKPPPRGFDDARACRHAVLRAEPRARAHHRQLRRLSRRRSAAWRRVARASAAHSVLVVGDTNAVEIDDDGALGRAPRLGALRARRGGGASMDRRDP